MVADGAGRQLHAVADDVVLERLDAEDGVLVVLIERQERLAVEIRHRERVVRKVDLLVVLVPFVHREIDDPAELERALADQFQFLPELGARLAGEVGGARFLVGGKEHGIARFRRGASGKRGQCRGWKELGDRALAGEDPVLFLEHDVAEARRALAPRPFVHLVEPGARLRRGARRGDGAHRFLALEGFERDILAVEDVLHVRDHDRIAQIRLVGAVQRQRLGIGNARERRRRDLAPLGEFVEHAGEHRLDRREHVFLRDEAHLEIELVEFAGARSARASSSRKHGAIWK